ncbi:MAG: archaeal proteasome endopeptidase complex subunit beta [Candidatus Aenigmarchaeota archaeon]|nr:archaeal proteasome endopeptidase complex subunit beta [Candidatus Aenigmarchaeota archaeon]
MLKDAEIPKKIETGTTTVGMICSDGVVIGAEKKATMGYLVASKKAEKVRQLDNHIGMTIAGVVGDAQALERYIKAELRLYHLKEKRPIKIEAAANLISNMLYARRFYPYIVQLVVGGYDTKPRLFSFAPDGSLIEEDEYFSSGSGSPMAFGVLENGYKKGIDVARGKKLIVDAISSAVQRDIASGGEGIDLAVIDANGFRRVPVSEVEKLMKK